MNYNHFAFFKAWNENKDVINQHLQSYKETYTVGPDYSQATLQGFPLATVTPSPSPQPQPQPTPVPPSPPGGAQPQPSSQTGKIMGLEVGVFVALVIIYFIFWMFSFVYLIMNWHLLSTPVIIISLLLLTVFPIGPFSPLIVYVLVRSSNGKWMIFISCFCDRQMTENIFEATQEKTTQEKTMFLCLSFENSKNSDTNQESFFFSRLPFTSASFHKALHDSFFKNPVLDKIHTSLFPARWFEILQHQSFLLLTENLKSKSRLILRHSLPLPIDGGHHVLHQDVIDWIDI